MRAYALAGVAYREQGLFREAEKAYLEGLAVAPEDGGFLIWFRPALDLTVSWAGDVATTTASSPTSSTGPARRTRTASAG